MSRNVLTIYLNASRTLACKSSLTRLKTIFLYQAEYLYDALVNSTDDYLYVCDVQSDVFHYPKTMVEEFALPGEYIKMLPPSGVPRFIQMIKALFSIQPGNFRRTRQHSLC